MAVLAGTAILAGTFLTFGVLSPAAAVSKAECHLRYEICRGACRPDNHDCKRRCKAKFQNCMWKAS
jgi:hypothetical protein